MSELEALLAVQRLDNTLDQLRFKHDNLAQRAGIVDIVAELAALNAESAEAETIRDELRRQERDLEEQSNDLAEKAASLDSRLYGGLVTSPKEATAMTGEIANLKARVSEFEDEALELLVEIEPLDEALVETEAKRGELEAKRGALVGSLAGAETELDSEIASTTTDRATAAEPLEDARLELYRRMRITYGPDAVVEFDPTHNGGCPIAMSAVE
ncbi:MAG: putative nucleic acid-binding Zn-ribbon protein, partial [Verrucomicrobiales bacterium]